MSPNIHVDISDVDNELQRLDGAPDVAAILALESVLTGVFLATQRVVHVRTHSLKFSGRSHSIEHHHEWEGEIVYGGPSLPIANVRYAELEVMRGGAHDFMAPARAADGAFIEAMVSYLRGEL